MSINNILLGTSGWSYKEWEGAFYRKGEKSKLRAYARVFQIVEIDSTWYRYPSRGTVMGWLRYSPSNFIFTAKLPKLITHEKKLGLKDDVKSDLENFLEIMQPLQLNGKLGCLLIQLPPSYDYNPENLEAFFEMLSPQFKFAVEFRNLSWMRRETWQLLKKHNVAYANVDEPLLPPEVHITADFAYFRWHGRGEKPWFDYLYKEEELEPWIPKVLETSRQVKQVLGFFNNHFHGYAPENCLSLIEKILGLTPQQQEAKKRIKKKQVGLASFFQNN
ncbi:MAG: DUF72 domain-containing protein [Candidatus Bathyarchaeota archaeon]|nr:DUF72 domain-containing protein [Candidatus Bathyarchaeota archaeon]MDH5494551.1 DUF72 domain-containing protein [Candidatus Bathyarchaeota archaeon]